ncbi:peptide ABC transporter substrate-binding protein [Allobacillus halotolerans]|uniref:Peptide ABC transporter substrate-binding protein n=2 Tax=Allobacillus halotolerans TaxID=570278 RepID=A0ABS6GLR6_9BACI|nr:peptide ABC transporter substrate-binding protein [Allobacillus halotolerans]MBU6080084.1 peptide ABC transporter substrate-binding protein [Allobacillus halotolerans]
MFTFLVACTTGNDESSEGDSGSEDSNTEESSTDQEEAESDEESSSESSGKVLRLNNGSEPTSFDPPQGFNAVSWNALNNLMEGLTRLDESHQPAAGIAEDWNISDDGLEYTFTLREDANWSNGDPVTAEDFVFAWTRLLDPDEASPAAFLGYFIEGAEAFNNGEGSAEDLGLVAEDEKTLKVTLNAPTGFFLDLVSNPAFFPVNKAVAEENPDWHAEADSFVSNGPFTLSEWEHESHFTFKKNPEYWDAENVDLEEVHWAMVNEENTEYQMYESGELDTAAIPSDLAEQLLDNEDAFFVDQAGTYFYRFNVEMEPFQNEKIRKAFAKVINQEDIVQYITKNKEVPAKGFVSPGFTDANGNDFREESGDLLTHDPEEARQLLKEGMEEEGYDELPEVVLSYNTDDAHRAIAEYMAEVYSEELDVDVTLENTEWNVFLEDQKSLSLQFSRSSFLADYADPVNFLESFVTDSSMNRTGWSNEKYDELIANAKNEADEEKRYEYLYEAEQVLFDELPLFPIHFYNQVGLQKPEVSGVVRHPVGYLELKWASKE